MLEQQLIDALVDGKNARRSLAQLAVALMSFDLSLTRRHGTSLQTTVTDQYYFHVHRQAPDSSPPLA